MNKTFIALIPKNDNPDNIKLFRPISLCNVAYKIITKILVARIWPLLAKIISPFQSNFIPGRSTNDNIIITQEVLHTLRGKKGKKGGLIFKIDLEKAYDKVSWKFLFDTLTYFQFNASWIALIMNYVSSVKSSIQLIWRLSGTRSAKTKRWSCWRKSRSREQPWSCLSSIFSSNKKPKRRPRRKSKFTNRIGFIPIFGCTKLPHSLIHLIGFCLCTGKKRIHWNRSNRCQRFSFSPMRDEQLWLRRTRVLWR